jgi:hypothetical protein
MKKVTEKTKTFCVDSNTGEVIDIQTTETTKIINSKVESEKFWFIYSALLAVLKGDEPTRTAISVFAVILENYGSSTIGITKGVKEDIAKVANTSVKSVERCLGELTNCKMLIHTSRATYTVNPEYSFFGNSTARKELIVKLHEKKNPS